MVDRVSLRNLIDASRRLDELGIARIVANAAELVHKQQKGGQPLNTLTPDAVIVAKDGDVTVTATDAKPAYTAPERLRGEAGDRRSDVFSLGAVLWEALAHEPLFQGEVDGEIKAAVLEGEYRPVTDTNANVPSELDAICKKALAKSPADRYPSCKVMAAEIATVLDDAGYPEDNAQIAEYLATKYTPPEPKAKAEPPSRPTPLPVDTIPTIPATAPPTQTLQGIAPRAEIEAAKAKLAAAEPPKIEVKPPVLPESPLRPKQPTTEPSPSGTLPSWATSRAPSPPETSPSSTLPGIPSMLSTPPAETPRSTFSKTAVLGSMSSAELALPPVEATAATTAEPSQPLPIGKKTEVLGSPSVADRLAALNSSMPGLPAVPPGADPSLAPEPKPPPNITTAETVPTPSLATYAKAEANAAAALDSLKPATTPPPSQVVQMKAAPTPEASDEALPHPAGVVALPRPSRPGSEAGRGKTEGGGDPLRGWGWGTDSHPALEAYKPDEDEEYYEHQKSTKKRLVMAIGGTAAVLVIVIVAAFAFGGGKDKSEDKKKEEVAAKNTEPAVDWSQPTDPPPAPTQPAVDPNAGSATGSGSGVDVVSSADQGAGSAAVVDPNAVDPNAAGSAVEPTKVEVATTEPPKPEPPKPEPPKVEPPKPVAKVEPPKPEPPKPVAKTEPPKAVAKTEPKKEPPPKKTARLPDPKPAKNTGWDPLVKRPKETAKPVDPYAEPPKKVDANVAYKTGIQQFARGDANGALATFKASLDSNPNFAPTWRGIGMVYEKLGKRALAKNAFKKYLALSPAAGDAEQIRERMERL